MPSHVHALNRSLNTITRRPGGLVVALELAGPVEVVAGDDRALLPAHVLCVRPVHRDDLDAVVVGDRREVGRPQISEVAQYRRASPGRRTSPAGASRQSSAVIAPSQTIVISAGACRVCTRCRIEGIVSAGPQHSGHPSICERSLTGLCRRQRVRRIQFKPAHVSMSLEWSRSSSSRASTGFDDRVRCTRCRPCGAWNSTVTLTIASRRDVRCCAAGRSRGARGDADAARRRRAAGARS